MAGVGPTDLQDLSQQLLEAAVEALDTIPDYDPDLLGAPDRQFISPGLPVDDCEQVAVYTIPIAEAPTAPLLLGAATRHRQQFAVNLVGLRVRVSRECLPQPAGMGGPPPVSVENSVSAQLNADAWALWNHIWNMARAGLIFSICEELYRDSITPIPPSGQIGGWVLSLRAQLQGYEEAL